MRALKRNQLHDWHSCARSCAQRHLGLRLAERAKLDLNDLAAFLIVEDRYAQHIARSLAL